MERTDALAKARELLIAVHDQPEVSALIARVVSILDPCKPSPDFSSVLWYGTTYYFTALQSKIVRLLWKAWRKNPNASLRHDFLMEKTGCESGRLVDLFKGNDAWGTMIVNGPVKGTLRLSKPQDAA